MFDLATIFRFEDLALEILRTTQLANKDYVFNRLIVNKLLNLNFNVSFTRKFDITKPEIVASGAELAKKQNISELITLNIFDLVQ